MVPSPWDPASAWEKWKEALGSWFLISSTLDVTGLLHLGNEQQMEDICLCLSLKICCFNKNKSLQNDSFFPYIHHQSEYILKAQLP